MHPSPAPVGKGNLNNVDKTAKSFRRRVAEKELHLFRHISWNVKFWFILTNAGYFAVAAIMFAWMVLSRVDLFTELDWPCTYDSLEWGCKNILCKYSVTGSLMLVVALVSTAMHSAQMDVFPEVLPERWMTWVRSIEGRMHLKRLDVQCVAVLFFLGCACFGWAESAIAIAWALPFQIASVLAKIYFESARWYIIFHGIWHMVSALSVFWYISKRMQPLDSTIVDEYLQ